MGSKDEEKSGEDWEGEEKPRKQKPDSGADELEQPKENEVSENALTVAVLEADEGSDLSKDQKSEKEFSREERVHDLMKKEKPTEESNEMEPRREFDEEESKRGQRHIRESLKDLKILKTENVKCQINLLIKN